MRYRIESLINDGKSEAPPLTVEVQTIAELCAVVAEELCNDYDVPFGPGATVTITREA